MLYCPAIQTSVGERFLVPTFVWLPLRIESYYTNARDWPSNKGGAIGVVVAASVRLVLAQMAEARALSPPFREVTIWAI
jgi:hypothetical protein